MRDKVLHRCSPSKAKGSSTRQMETEKKKRRAAIDLAFAEERDFLIEDVQSKAEMGSKHLKLGEYRQFFERWKGKEDTVRVRCAQEHETTASALNEKRIELEIRRASLDWEERKSALDERKQLITVLGALTEKPK